MLQSNCETINKFVKFFGLNLTKPFSKQIVFKVKANDKVN